MARRSDRADTTLTDLRTELPEYEIRIIARPESLQETDLGAVDCVVSEPDGREADPSKFLAEIRGDGSLVPFLLVVRPGSDVALNSFLATEQTDAIRIDRQSDDVSLLAHRIEMLIEMDRRRSKHSQPKNRYDTLFNKLTQPAVETKFDGEAPIVTRVNRAFEETFGYEGAEIVGESLDALVTPPDRTEEAKQLNRRALSGEVFSQEVTRQTTTGTRDFLLKTGVYDEPERFAVYTDITAQKRQKRELERKNERLDQFASMVSHDLRNPLNVAQIRMDSLTDEAEADEHAEAIRESLAKMESITDRMLTLARAGKEIETTEQCSLGQLVDEVWESLQTDGAELDSSTGDKTIEADPVRLFQVLENLLANAIDHNDIPLTVRVGTFGGRSEPGDATDPVGFFIEDNGSGIPENDRDAIFEHVYTTSDDGTGYGLSVVRQLVDAHGWEIHVTDGTDGGARFEIHGVRPG